MACLKGRMDRNDGGWWFVPLSTVSSMYLQCGCLLDDCQGSPSAISAARIYQKHRLTHRRSEGHTDVPRNVMTPDVALVAAGALTCTVWQGWIEGYVHVVVANRAGRGLHGNQLHDFSKISKEAFSLANMPLAS